MTHQIEERKDAHLDIVLNQQVEHRLGTLFDHVQVLHQSLPELSLGDISTQTLFLRKYIAAPVMITGMTGGSPRAKVYNQKLAELAAELDIALGVGSMRPMFAQRKYQADYDLRPYNPKAPLLGNLGVMQAKELPVGEVRDALYELGYDALCLHLNPAQELAQLEGDRSFIGAIDTIACFVEQLGLPVIVKETGAGMSPRTLTTLKNQGVQWVDVSGRGGTSWTKVEGLRAESDQIGLALADWGIPTAVSVTWAKQHHFSVIASGGIRHTQDWLASFVLGAKLIGLARPVLLMIEQEGFEKTKATIQFYFELLKRQCLLAGVKHPHQLPNCEYIITGELNAWLTGQKY